MAAPTASPSIDQIIAGWQSMYPGAPIPQGMQQAKDLGANYGMGSAYSTIPSPSGNPISLSQLALAGAPPAAAAAPAAATQPSSYLAPQPIINQGTATGAANMPAGTTQVGTGPGYTILRNAAGTANLAVDAQGNYFNIDPTTGAQTPVSQQQAMAAGFQPSNPESVALEQMGQIDPATEQLRQSLASSYLTPLSQGQTPTAAQFQSLLQTYGQVDPTSAAARTQLGSDLAAQEALGSKLDPATIRQLQQQTRIGQTARGNVYGTPQLVQEAMTTGEAGLALQQQRQQALQSYLTSGASTGDVAMNLYNQQQNQLRSAQGAALGYMSSGQTPYQAGSSYLNMANQNAASAAQGGAAYNPQAQSPYYTGQGVSSFPQYGLDTAQTSANYLNLMNAYNQPMGAQKNKGGAAAQGALTGAISGATAGTAISPGIGTAVGALGGAVLGGASGYFS